MRTSAIARIVTLVVTFGVVVAPSAPAWGQSINIAFGPVGVQPSSGYAAAGVAGYWNQLVAGHNTTTGSLRKLDGTVTPADVWQFGGTELRSTNDPGTGGDDEKLMDHCLVTYTSNLESCLFFHNLQLGDYEVIIYAMMPRFSTIKSYTNCDEEFGNPHEIVGGAWPGHHEESVTYSRHLVTVTTGLLRAHSGIVPGQPPASGAALNGIQLRKLPARTPGDTNCDGAINGKDIEGFVSSLLEPEAYYAQHDTCRIDNADMNNDHAVNFSDVQLFINQLLP